jgi:histidinol-phosphate/aromatic aminotransferase/cobyric acid decarboxylase-like protein
MMAFAGIPTPGSHGGDAERIARSMGRDLDSLLDLSASLNPVGPNVPRLAAARLDSLRRYPDASQVSRTLALALGVPPERLLLTNGGSEAIALLAEELGGRTDEPDFSLYPRGPGSAPRWRSDPHNPTGLLAPDDESADVWDEAFYPLAAGRWTKPARASVAVVGSLTKVFACPGLRMGYVLGDPEMIMRLEARQPQWSVGSLAIGLLPELLEMADLGRWQKEIAVLRHDLTDVLRQHGLRPRPSDANFVLCDGRGGLRDRLLSEGIVVRDCSSFGMADLVRIAVPDPTGLERLSAALDAIDAMTFAGGPAAREPQ